MKYLNMFFCALLVGMAVTSLDGPGVGVPLGAALLNGMLWLDTVLMKKQQTKETAP